MEPERWRRVDELFHRALEVDTGRRGTFLAEACADDTSLRREVESLLGSDRRAASFIEIPGASAIDAPASPTQEPVEGRTIGRYRLLGPLGVGGMGAVYLAERADGEYRQKVALKLVKRGMDTDEIVRRFRQERQTLANLDHTNIGRLLDGGVSDDGRPFLVMEHIEGEPIDRYCDAHRLAVPERLELFRQVCAGVQYAHQNLVVHRDIKPGNILVTPAGVPKLLDFGIAKVLHPQGDPATRDQTAPGARLLTPHYASPEQLRAAPITTATDVYSLGVVLYELLTGRRPFDGQEQSLAELERAVCEEEPQRPSARAAPATGRPPAGPGSPVLERAECRATDPRTLSRALRGDLDTIVLTALRKEPERRFQSVDQLAEDIRRHLAGLPVQARADTLRYRASKFVRRNRVLVGAAASVLVVSIAGFGVSTRLYLQAEAARSAEAGHALLAEEKAAEADRTRREAQFGQYVATIAAATLALRAYDVGDARRLLDQAPQSLRGWEWRYLARRLDTSIATTSPHAGRVRCLAVSPDGATVAFGCDDGTARLWDPRSGAPPRSIPAHDGIVDAIAFSPDGSLLATGATDLKIRLWDSASGARVRTFDQYPGHTGHIHDLAFSPDGAIVASASADRTARLWETATGRPIATLAGHGHRVGSVVFSPDGSTIATSSWDGTARVWDAVGHGLIRELAGHSGQVHDVAFSPDGTTIATAADDGTARLWDASTGKELRRFLGQTGAVRSVAFSPDGARLVTSSWDHSVRVWDVATAEPVAVLVGHRGPVNEAVIFPDGATIASASADETVKLWDLRSEEARIYRDHSSWVYGVAVSPDGAIVASTGGARDPQPVLCIRLFDTATGRERFRLIGHTEQIVSVAFSPDGTLLASASADRTVRLWDPATGEAVDVLRGHEHGIWCVAFSPDGSLIASGARDGIIRLWDVKARRPLRILKGHSDVVRALAFNPDGTILVSTGSDSRLLLWKVADGSLERRLDPRAGELWSLCFGPRAETLAAGTSKGTFLLWDTATWALRPPVPAHASTVSALCLSPDGTRLASGSADGAIKLWETATWNEVATLHGHNHYVQSLAFAPDGNLLVSGSADQTVRLWDGRP